MAGLSAASLATGCAAAASSSEGEAHPRSRSQQCAAHSRRTGVAMTTHALHPISTSGIAAGIALLVASCSLLPQRQPEHGQAARATQTVPVRHIAQMDFGRDASFAVCTEPACPAITPKTLAV